MRRTAPDSGCGGISPAPPREWDGLGRPDTELYQGVRLEAALEWARHAESQPTRLEQEFLDDSAAHADAERRALAAQAAHQRSQNRRLRGALAGVAALLVVALVAAFFAVDQSRTAAGERDVAREARGAAVHESLVSRSLSLRSTKRDIAALLAVEAHHTRPDALSQAALLGTFTEAPGFMGYATVPYHAVHGDVVPGTRTAVVASGTRMHVMDLDTGELGPPFRHPLKSDRDPMSGSRSAETAGGLPSWCSRRTAWTAAGGSNRSRTTTDEAAPC